MTVRIGATSRSATGDVRHFRIERGGLMHEVDAARVRDFAKLDALTRAAAAGRRAGVQNDHGTNGGYERRDHNETTPRKHGLNDIRPRKVALVSLPMTIAQIETRSTR